MKRFWYLKNVVNILRFVFNISSINKAFVKTEDNMILKEKR